MTAGQTIPAFPGADGAAANVTGGRGGVIYHVTKLNGAVDDAEWDTPGTLRYGLNDANFGGQARIIVFDVGGTINLGRLAQEGWNGNGNGWDTQSRLNIPSNVTIAGQTAPGGIAITGGLIKVGGNNVVIRNLTVAPGYGNRNFHDPGDTGPTVGDFPDSYVYDAFDISGTNVMIDHCTTVYATDETISCNEAANNLTVQYCNISQGQNYPQADAESSGVSYTGHALGSLLQAGSNAKISVHHNLYAHQKGRLPRVGSEVGTGAYNDFRNNVFYNWFGTGGSGASGQPSYNNFVGNFHRAGPGGDDVSQTTGPDGQSGTLDDIGVVVPRSGGTGIFSGSNSSGTRVYHSGNVKDTNKDGDANDGVALTNADFGSSSFQPNPLWSGGVATYNGVTDTATVAFNRVLNYVGANWWDRSAIDQRIINETVTGTGKIKAWADDPFNSDPNEGTEWRELVNRPMTTHPAGWDTDNDGLPQYWEDMHLINGITTVVPTGDLDSDGYKNIEEYLNDISAWPAPEPVVFNGATSARFALITNWDANSSASAVHNWQPSRFDTAKINSGVAVVDAVGQHAGTLLVGNSAGGNAQLNVTAGWIIVEDRLEVGSTTTGVGSVNLSGGSLRVGNITRVRDNGKVNFSGGVLDITGGSAIFDYAVDSPMPDIRAQVTSARNGGAWNGPGITSSAVALMPGTGVGVAEAGEIGLTEFSGEGVDATTVLVKFTWLGDSNLDGQVTIADLGNLASNWQSTASGWSDGDFNYDGAVTISDLGELASNWQAGVGSPLGMSFNEALAAVGLSAVVPEPSLAGVVMATAAATTTLARRRRTQRA